MDACRYGSGCWRPLCPYGHSGGRAARWAALWALLENQEYGSEDERTVERTIDEPPKVNLAESSGEAGSSWSGAHDTTSPADKPPYGATTESELSEHSDEGEAGPSRSGAYDTTSFAKSGGEARPLELAQHSATTEPDLAEYSVEGAAHGTTIRYMR